METARAAPMAHRRWNLLQPGALPVAQPHRTVLQPPPVGPNSRASGVFFPRSRDTPRGARQGQTSKHKHTKRWLPDCRKGGRQAEQDGFGESMVDVAISVSFAAALSVFLGWCLWRVCNPEINLQEGEPSNHISATVPGSELAGHGFVSDHYSQDEAGDDTRLQDDRYPKGINANSPTARGAR